VVILKESGKIAVLGDGDSVELFKAAGAEVFTADNEMNALQTLKRLVSEKYAIVFVTENIAVMLEKQIEELKSQPFPVVIPIPSASGTNGFGMAGISRDVEKAVGVDIFK
jgi:V/A-type H+-transporting ATPase subunit F